MNIEPLKGLDLIEFGTLSNIARDIFGEPDATEKDGISNDKWSYHNLGLEFYFDPDEEFGLCSINVRSKDVSLEGSYPVGLTDEELNTKFPNLTLNVADGRFKEYEYNSNEIEFWLKDDIVYMVCVYQKIDMDQNEIVP